MTPIDSDRPDALGYRIERLTGPDTDAVAAAVEPLLREYVAWAGHQLTDLGMRFSNLDDAMEAHHAAFRAELPRLLGPRGQLLLVRLHGEPVGLGALKPVDASTAEIKRMYVRQHARGHGLGRELLEQLLAAARDEHYQVARLETLPFMTEAQALYESLGFRDTPIFEGSEAAISGFEQYTRYMELPLDGRASPVGGRT
jgi:GNAT superfamily N-acetyltransferase